MEEKKITKEEILKEIENVLNLYDDEIIHLGYSINFIFKDCQRVEIHKNHYTQAVTGFACGVNSRI